MTSLAFDLSARSGLDALPRGRSLHFEPNFFLPLKIMNDLKQVTSLRIPRRAEHAHQALRRVARASCQFIEAHGRVNVIAQHSFARFHVSGEKALNRFAQQFPSECRITPRPRLNRLLEISG